MRGCMKLLGGMAAVLFVITAVIALLLTNLTRVMTDRAAVKTALANSEKVLVTAAPEVILEALQQEAVAQGLPPLPVDTAVLATAVTELLPPDWLSTQTDTAVDTLFDALETGDLTGTAVELDAAPLLERLRGEPGRQAIAVVVQSLPPCTEPVSGFDLQTGAVSIPNCLPPQVSADEVTRQVHTSLVNALDATPQIDAQVGVVRLPLLANGEQTPQTLAEFQRARRSFLLIQQGSWLLWLVPAGCLLLILLFAVRSWGEWGRWWGWPLVGTAVIALFLAFALPALSTFLLRTAALTTASANSLILPLDQLLRDLAEPLLDLWQRQILIQAGALFAIGGLLLLLGLLARQGGKPPA